jgi:mannose/fructose/N-acetylgalactosamine-specific phosphotransferase system component IID
MYLVAITWLYVALMMAVAEATSTQGTVIGAIFTFLLYGLGPVSLVMYLLGTPARRRARRAVERQEEARLAETAASPEPDQGGHAPGAPVAPERKEP